MSYLDELLDVVYVCAADIGVEEDRVAIAILPLYEIVEVGAHMFKRFWQPGSFLDGVYRKIDCGDSGIGERVDHPRTKQTRIGFKVDPKIFLCGVVHHFVHEVRAQERLATSRSQYAAGVV